MMPWREDRGDLEHINESIMQELENTRLFKDNPLFVQSFGIVNIAAAPIPMNS